MTKFERAAARIAQATGLHVEYANGEYIVDCRACGSSARVAERLAKQIAVEVDAR